MKPLTIFGKRIGLSYLLGIGRYLQTCAKYFEYACRVDNMRVALTYFLDTYIHVRVDACIRKHPGGVLY